MAKYQITVLTTVARRMREDIDDGVNVVDGSEYNTVLIVNRDTGRFMTADSIFIEGPSKLSNLPLTESVSGSLVVLETDSPILYGKDRRSINSSNTWSDIKHLSSTILGC